MFIYIAKIRNKINISEKGIFFIIFKQKRQEIMDHVESCNFGLHCMNIRGRLEKKVSKSKTFKVNICVPKRPQLKILLTIKL